MCAHTDTHTNKQTHRHTKTHICTQTHTQTHIYIYIYIYIYTHTHTHIIWWIICTVVLVLDFYFVLVFCVFTSWFPCASMCLFNHVCLVPCVSDSAPHRFNLLALIIVCLVFPLPLVVLIQWSVSPDFFVYLNPHVSSSLCLSMFVFTLFFLHCVVCHVCVSRKDSLLWFKLSCVVRLGAHPYCSVTIMCRFRVT